MTPEEYKKASGAGNTKGINKDLRLAKLIIKFLSIVAPKKIPLIVLFVRELKLDGPLEDIERTINKLKKDERDDDNAKCTNYFSSTDCKV